MKSHKKAKHNFIPETFVSFKEVADAFNQVVVRCVYADGSVTTMSKKNFDESFTVIA
jgi:hypothetical protein